MLPYGRKVKVGDLGCRAYDIKDEPVMIDFIEQVAMPFMKNGFIDDVEELLELFGQISVNEFAINSNGNL